MIKELVINIYIFILSYYIELLSYSAKLANEMILLVDAINDHNNGQVHLQL